jgi:hypothetical protein
METEVLKPTYINYAFISYSRKDIEFARKLEKALEDYKPPKDLNVPQRNLVIFRDESDFTGVQYEESIEKHLKTSKKMIVICSPDARKSKYVDDEIRRFAEARGAENITLFCSQVFLTMKQSPVSKRRWHFQRHSVKRRRCHWPRMIATSTCRETG